MDAATIHSQIRSFFAERIPALLFEEGSDPTDAAVLPFKVAGALAVLSCLVTIPATQYRTMYGFTVGYGASVGLIGLFLWHHSGKVTTMLVSSPHKLLPLSAAIYGFRLALYLLVRDLGGWKARNEDKKTADASRWKRIAFAVSLSILYGCMTCPILYVIRFPPLRDSWEEAVSILASHLACAAAVVEAVADAHKSICKYRAHRSNPKSASGESKPTFVGPTSGLYAITRHPNYGAEILYWTAVWVCGMPSYGTLLGAWITSTMGWICIVMIMVGSTKRLEANQRKEYQDQPDYKEWVKRVPYPLFPGIE